MKRKLTFYVMLKDIQMSVEKTLWGNKITCHAY